MEKNYHIFDKIVYSRIIAILLELSLSNPVKIVDDYDERYSIRYDGPWALYTFHLEIEKEYSPDKFLEDFKSRLEQQNAGSDIKPVVVEGKDYTAPFLNTHSYYLTVAIS